MKAETCMNIFTMHAVVLFQIQLSEIFNTFSNTDQLGDIDCLFVKLL